MSSDQLLTTMLEILTEMREIRQEFKRFKDRERWRLAQQRKRSAQGDVPKAANGAGRRTHADVKAPPVQAKPPAPKKPLPPEKKEAVRNGWATWIDVHRALGMPAPVPSGPDTMASAQLSKHIPDREELAGIMRAYLQDDDKFIASNGHALRYLPGRVNKYREREAIVEMPAKDYDALKAEMAKTGDAPPARFRRVESPLPVNTEPLSDDETDDALG